MQVNLLRIKQLFYRKAYRCAVYGMGAVMLRHPPRIAKIYFVSVNALKVLFDNRQQSKMDVIFWVFERGAR